MSEKYVSQSEAARQAGVCKQRVNDLVKKGIIQCDAHKRVPLEETIGVIRERQATEITVRRLQQRSSSPPLKVAAPQASAKEDGDVFMELTEAKRDLTKAQARLKEYEQRQREGELVETAAVAQEGAALGALVREWMSSAPARYSGYLEMKTQREAEVELKKMMQDLNKLFQSSKYTKEGG